MERQRLSRVSEGTRCQWKTNITYSDFTLFILCIFVAFVFRRNPGWVSPEPVSGVLTVLNKAAIKDYSYLKLSVLSIKR